MDISDDSMKKMMSPDPRVMPPRPKRVKNSLGKASTKEPLSCGECNQTFAFKNLLVAHTKSAHRVTKPFKCTMCRKSFKKEAYLLIHERVHDDRTSVTCNICFRKFPYISTLRFHQASHSKDRADSDFPKCKFTTNFRRRSRKVLQDSNATGYNASKTSALLDQVEPKVSVTEGVPPPKELSSQAMDTDITESNSSFLKPQDSCVPEDIKTQPVADKACNSGPPPPMQPSNSEPMKSKDKILKPFKCSLCPKGFKKDAYLKIHMRIHDKRTECICNICFKSFPLKCKLRVHQRLTHFRNKSNVKIPKRPHLDIKDIGEKPNRGQINVGNPNLENRSDDFEEQLVTPPSSANPPVKRRKKKVRSIDPPNMCSGQVTTDEGVKTKTCDVFREICTESINSLLHQCSGLECCLCDRAFSDMWDLYKHIMEHKTEKNYPCHLCEKRFLQTSELKEHFSKHTADSYHFCHFWNQSFSQPKSLDTHVVQHTSEQKFVCQFCNKCFLQQSDLDPHLTDHIVNENFPCETCGLLFLSRADLKEHLALHC